MPNFKAALAAYNTKNYQSAIKLIDKFCPLDFNANLLKAASLSALNKDAQAAEIYAELLNIKPGSTLLLESYTSLLLKLGDFEACLQLTSSPYLPASHQICLNKLEALIKSDKLMEAKKFISLLDIPEKLEFKFIWLKINLYESLGELEKIEKLISELPVNKAKNFYISYKRGCNLRSMGFFANALEILLRLKKDHKVTPEILYLIGCIYNDLNDSANCEYYLKQCLSIAPYYIPAHESLNKLYSANNNRRSFLSSYITVKQKYEPHPALEHSFISQLIRTDKTEEALNASTYAINLFPNDLDLRHAHCIALGRLNEHQKAVNQLNDLVNKAPHISRYRLDLSNYLICNGEYLNAIKHLESALKYDYYNQEVWAYLGTAWRLSNNDKYEWLTNYSKFVKVVELEKPPGYKSSEQFLDALTDFLLNLHLNSSQLIDQSVKYGSQTEGHLLFRSNKLINDFKHSMNSCITSYLANLPKDQKHPLCSRNNNSFKVNGSWSVKLGNKGFHTNHIHPAGWLSAPSYISLPKELNENDPKKSGWLKLGETCLNLKEKEEVARNICPKTGQMIIFPSYIWHGTYPLESTQPRLTVPCDIMPIF